MNLFPVFKFIVHHFLQANIHSVVIFNCWDINSQFNFLQTANDHLLRTQMVDINMEIQYPGEYFKGILTNLGVFLDFNCNKSERILNKSSDFQLFIAKYDWLIIDGDHKSLEFRQQFEETMMSVDAQITYARMDGTTFNGSVFSFKLHDVYNNGKFLGGKLNITVHKQVTCDKEKCEMKYLSDLHLRTKYGHRCNLNDTTFRVSAVANRININSSEEVLQEYLFSMNNSHVDSISRYGFKLAVILQDMMNYKVRYIYRSIWSSNETSGGSFGDVSDGDAELSSSIFILTLRRLKFVNVILQTGDFRSVFVFRTPRNEGLYGGVFLHPFSPLVWIVFGIVILLFAVLLWAIFTIEFRIVPYIRFIPSLLSTFLISFGLACFQGANLIPRTTGGRIAFFSLSVVTFIMYNYYMSTVVSSLVGSPLKSNIKTLGQLADSNLEIGIEPVTYTKVFLNISRDPDVMKFVRKKLTGRLGVDPGLWLTAEEGTLRAKDGGFAYHSETSSLYPVIEKFYKQHELCDLNQVSLRPEKSLVSIIGKMSRYKEIVRLSLIRMMERGVLSRHRHYWMKTKLHCFSNTFLNEVGMEYTGPLFVFLGIFYILTLIILILEIAVYKCTH